MASSLPPFLHASHARYDSAPIYYSMFGFQRIGDLMWLAGDIKPKTSARCHPVAPPSMAKVCLDGTACPVQSDSDVV
jgi:hypothetical protein